MGVYLLCAELAPLLAKTRKLWKQSALSRGEEVSSIPFPQLRNSFCRVTRKVTYIIYGQKAGLACFWMTGSRTKRKKKLKFPSWPQNENLPLCWHLLHSHCVIWFCTDSLNRDYLYVTVIHLYTGFLIENASMSQLSYVWKYVPQCLPLALHRDLFCFPPWHHSLLCVYFRGAERCVHLALRRVPFHPLAIGPGWERGPEAARQDRLAWAADGSQLREVSLQGPGTMLSWQ